MIDKSLTCKAEHSTREGKKAGTEPKHVPDTKWYFRIIALRVRNVVVGWFLQPAKQDNKTLLLA